EAICYQDWYKAIELTSTLVVSSSITPDERQTFLNLRRDFYAHLKGNNKSGETVICERGQLSPLKTEGYQSSTPQFSSRSNHNTVNTPERYCYQIETNGYLQEVDPRCSDDTVRPSAASSSHQTNSRSSLWAVGARVEGNSIKGKLLNNGLATANNVTLTIRSQKDNQSEAVKTVAIDAVSAWSETEFVATFNHSPRNWMIEQISIN
ncbi:MAG: hypothetical protein AAGF93_21825, partial [Cyanobacteria bacterium P01_H01_bin.105]